MSDLARALDLNSKTGISVRLAETPAEIAAAQNVRYRVFYKEQGAIPTAEMAKLERDFDLYDQVADHLIVTDPSLGSGTENVVGTYRLMREEHIAQLGKKEFYSSAEYDLTTINNCGAKLLELGRSCVLPEYRSRQVLNYLWEGIAVYLAEHQIDLMFGCGSLHGTDADAIGEQLSYLYYYHMAPRALRPRAHDSVYVPMKRHDQEYIQANAKNIFMQLPPLIKGYMRVGAVVGDGAYIDHQFNTTDVSIVMPTYLLTDKYLRHFERKTQKNITFRSPFAEALETMFQENA